MSQVHELRKTTFSINISSKHIHYKNRQFHSSLYTRAESLSINAALYEGSARKSNALTDNVGLRMRAPLDVYEETLSHLNLSVIIDWEPEGTKIESVLRFSDTSSRTD